LRRPVFRQTRFSPVRVGRGTYSRILKKANAGRARLLVRPRYSNDSLYRTGRETPGRARRLARRAPRARGQRDAREVPAFRGTAQHAALLVPVAEYDASRARAVQLENMLARSMRVAVNQIPHAVLAHGGEDRGLGHIHDFRRLLCRRAAALLARAAREAFAFLDRFREELALPALVAGHGAKRQIVHVIGTKRIPVHEQRRQAVEIDAGGIGKQAAAGLALEARAEQEVPVALHDEDRRAGVRYPAQRVDDRPILRLFHGVVADPVLEEIAED